MKAFLAVIVGIIALVGIAACAIASGIVPNPTATQNGLPSAPTLAPVPIPTPDPSASIFTLSESDLNAQLAGGIRQGEISNARVDLHPNNLADFSATVGSGSLSLEPKVSIEIQVQDGRLVLNVLKVEVGGFGVPSSMIEPQIAQLKQTAERELNEQFEEIRSRTGQTLQSVSTTEDSLSLYFSP